MINNHKDILYAIIAKAKMIYNKGKNSILNKLQQIKDIKLNYKKAEFLATLYIPANNSEATVIKTKYKKRLIDLIKKFQINHSDFIDKKFVIYNNL